LCPFDIPLFLCVLRFGDQLHDVAHETTSSIGSRPSPPTTIVIGVAGFAIGGDLLVGDL
jgi:hypothetical protein